MNKIDDGGPVYPSPEIKGQKVTDITTGITENWGSVPAYKGMSLRDYYAGMALQGLISAQANPLCHALPITQADFDICAEASYGYADAMIKARGGKE